MNTPPDYPKRIDPEEIRARQRGSAVESAARIVRTQYGMFGVVDIAHIDALDRALQEPMPAWEPDALPEVHVFPEDAA